MSRKSKGLGVLGIEEFIAFFQFFWERIDWLRGIGKNHMFTKRGTLKLNTCT